MANFFNYSSPSLNLFFPNVYTKACAIEALPINKNTNLQTCQECRGVLALARPSPRRADGCADSRCTSLVLRRRHAWRPTDAITTLRPKGTFMNAGSTVPLASAAQARAKSSMDCHMDMLLVYASVDPSSQTRARSC